MSASDLPDMRHKDGDAMIRALVTYMDDPVAVRSAVMGEFEPNKPPSLSRIRRLREEHLASLVKRPEAPFKAYEGYRPQDASQAAASASKRFVQAIELERALSVERAKAQGALDSPSLRHPAIVNRAWDREIERAWLRSTELGQ